jgi:hypothetical protein
MASLVPAGGQITFNALRWDESRDVLGVLSPFPLVIDTFRRPPDEVPMLIGAFRRVFVVTQLLPQAADGIRHVGEVLGGDEAAVGLRLARELLAGASGGADLLRDNAISLYTQDTWLYRAANRLLRGTSEPGEERLWPFVSILQMSLIRTRPKENDGGLIYRSAIIERRDLERVEVV